MRGKELSLVHVEFQAFTEYPDVGDALTEGQAIGFGYSGVFGE